MITKERIIERCVTYRECADRHFAMFPSRDVLDHRHSWLKGAWDLASELGVTRHELGEHPNDWIERHRAGVKAERTADLP